MKKSLKDRRRFHIGQMVIVSAVLGTARTRNGRKFIDREALPQKKFAQIVGIKRLFGGKAIFEDYPHLSVDNSEEVWLVRFGVRNREVAVRDSDVEEYDLTDSLRVPLLDCKCCPWTEADRQFLREEMKDFPRDSKGRWLKRTERKD